jgi:hypothetical protein
MVGCRLVLRTTLALAYFSRVQVGVRSHPPAKSAFRQVQIAAYGLSQNVPAVERLAPKRSDNVLIRHRERRAE